MSKVIHFELSVDDPQKAAAFYGNVFGWKVMPAYGDDYIMVHGDSNEPGIDGAIMRRRQPGLSTVNVISVANYDAALEAIKSNGGTVVSDRMDIENVGIAAYCLDPEGNTFGILEPAFGNQPQA